MRIGPYIIQKEHQHGAEATTSVWIVYDQSYREIARDGDLRVLCGKLGIDYDSEVEKYVY